MDQTFDDKLMRAT